MGVGRGPRTGKVKSFRLLCETAKERTGSRGKDERCESKQRFGTMLFAICVLVLAGSMSQSSAAAQAVSSLPVAIYQGTCSSDSIEHLVGLEPIVPAASVTGATFAGSDEAIDVAIRLLRFEITFADLMSNAPLAIIVGSGTSDDATELACGVIGGFVSDDRLSSASTMSTIRASRALAALPISEPQCRSRSSSVSSRLASRYRRSGRGRTGDDCVGTEVAWSPRRMVRRLPAMPTVTPSQTPMKPRWAPTRTMRTTDGDGMADGMETGFDNTDPLDTDSFGIDSDVDGLPDAIESSLGTDSTVADTDNDGISDGWEFFLRNDPLDPAYAGSTMARTRPSTPTRTG